MSAIRITPQLKAALEYAARSWAVHPLKGKVPYLSSWPRRATTDPRQIRELWRKYPDVNVGIVTGRRSGLVVLDIDSKNGKDGPRSLQLLENEIGALPSTLEARTPHGRHLYFAETDIHIPNSVSRLGIGIDVKGENGYVVAPPSTINGMSYQWVDRSALIARFPRALVSGVNSPALPRSDFALDKGNRNDGLFRLACAMRGRDVPELMISETLHHLNSQHCKPPLPPSDVDAILRSALRYEPPTARARSNPSLPPSDVLGVLDGRPIPVKWLHEEPKPIDFLVKDWIPRGSVTLLVAEGGTGKTMLAMRLALAVATGDRWLGLETRRGPVLYLAMEDPESELRRRLWRMLPHKQASSSSDLFLRRVRRNLHLRSLAGKQFQLLQQRGGQVEQSDLLAPLIEKLRPHNYSVIVMSRLHGSEENSNSVGTTVINAVEKIALSLGATVIVPHHTGKSNASTQNSGQYSARGASAIADAARVVMRLVADEGDPASLRLIHAKCNYGPRQPDIWLRREGGDLFAYEPESADTQHHRMLDVLRQWSAANGHPPIFQRTIHERLKEVFSGALSRRKALAVFDRAKSDGDLILTARGDNPKALGYTFEGRDGDTSQACATTSGTPENIGARVGDTSCPDRNIRKRHMIKRPSARLRRTNRSGRISRTRATRRGGPR